ncbi:hypothetical protein CC1G_12527 [Coprinopsis cinerea okayama7|uniref:Uncharacterized protein n=1 Tax=Coprinopsis cinerea (strain Okayama-7 / 130 / ATCC MYA-4618 / FGSC 9003) TaxID=240176 RepID=A8NMW5_COPC7|nr:hypothetical protein CC1G_12527 [Coprinopsis cinerea okayama7\|eukprot:XP_001835002.2 hypothetical protein CC1G_12527 [Coprinopsis cinerea okayama7\
MQSSSDPGNTPLFTIDEQMDLAFDLFKALVAMQRYLEGARTMVERRRHALEENLAPNPRGWTKRHLQRAFEASVRIHNEAMESRKRIMESPIQLVYGPMHMHGGDSA